MELGLHVTLKQQISPQLMYSLKLLQYTTLELELEIKEKLEENPLLEIEEDEEDQEEPGEREALEAKNSDGGQVDAEPELKNDEGNIDWDAYIKDGMNYQQDSREEFEKKEEQDILEREGNLGMTLEHALLEQFHLIEVSSLDREIGEYLIGNLEDDGLLDISLEYVASELEFISGKLQIKKRPIQSEAFLEVDVSGVQVEVEEVERVLKIIQTLEPTGVGARSIQECLLLQLQAMELGDSLAAKLVSEHWEDVRNRRIAAIKKMVKANVEDIQHALKIIAGLNPHPGLTISDAPIIPVFPDLFVEKVDGDYIVLLNDRQVPRLRISRAYHAILTKGSKSSESERQYVRQKLNDAKWVVDSIEQRRSTMMKVMTYIVEAQRGFLDNGLAYLRPMILQNVADHVGVHAATVSRVTQGKYVQTPRGLFKLKFFFDGMIPKEGGGEMATKSVKDRLARLIREEDATAPLSDDGLMKILQSEGMQIKRRTVAKYRDQIGIPVARMRKQI